MFKALSTSGSVLLLLMAVCLSPPPWADDDGYGEIGIVGGFLLPDRDLSGKPEKFSEIEPMTGLRGGYLFADRWGWFIDASWAEFNANTTAGDTSTVSGRTGVEWFSRSHSRKLQWFVGAGVGLLDVKSRGDMDFDRPLVALGFGQRVALDQRTHFRWELRGDRTIDDDGLAGADLDRLQALVNVSWRVGKIRRDSDGDGVRDRNDECPDTPRGATVDARGCPSDSDGDGVWDGIDQCPGTPRGATVDARGCPSDSDGDGVWDGIDQCPGTPRGATVDARGCPGDSDRDGVWNGIDQCPDTPRGAIVDARGCPRDSDGDGVWDGIDQCPDTPKGVPVTPTGCPRAAPLFTQERATLVLKGVGFQLNKAVLTSESRTTLDRVARSLKDWPEVRVEVAGHTDSTGTEEYNFELSRKRAVAVRNYLIGKGVPADQMIASGYGEGSPIADNKTSAGRTRNRRVELVKK